MNLNFTPEDMIKSLNKLGYEVKNETVMVEDRHGDEKPHAVYNVYSHGENSCPWGSYGTYRLEYVFKSELERKLLSLF